MLTGFKYREAVSKITLSMLAGEITKDEAEKKIQALGEPVCQDNGRGWCDLHRQLYKEC